MWKVYQKWKCIKLKSVQILLKIAGLTHRKSYVANSVKSLPKEKCCQVKVGSNIAQNRLCSWLGVICCHYLYQFIYKIYQKWNIAQNHFHISQFDLYRSSKVKGIPVKKSWGQLKDHIHVHAYDFLYVFQVSFGHNMHHSEDAAH